jgi:hypothetical protein
MPNYCDNYVTFYGDQKDLEIINERFSRYREHDYFTNFAEMVLGETLSDISTFEWGYSYGTKWWEFEIQDIGEGYLNIQGPSAWSPPLQLIAEITKVFNVRAEGSYYEPGCDFAGNYTAEDGNLEDNEMTCFEYDISCDREYAIDRLIEDLNDEIYDLEYVENNFKQHLTDDEWNQVLTETKNK